MTIAKVGLHLQSFDNGMSEKVANSAASDTPTNEMYPLSDTSTTFPSDKNCYSSSTNIATSAFLCEEATIPTGNATKLLQQTLLVPLSVTYLVRPIKKVKQQWNNGYLKAKLKHLITKSE